jgi:hypothetical protein
MAISFEFWVKNLLEGAAMIADEETNPDGG